MSTDSYLTPVPEHDNVTLDQYDQRVRLSLPFYTVAPSSSLQDKIINIRSTHISHKEFVLPSCTFPISRPVHILPTGIDRSVFVCADGVTATSGSVYSFTQACAWTQSFVQYKELSLELPGCELPTLPQSTSSLTRYTLQAQAFYSRFILGETSGCVRNQLFGDKNNSLQHIFRFVDALPRGVERDRILFVTICIIVLQYWSVINGRWLERSTIDESYPPFMLMLFLQRDGCDPPPRISQPFDLFDEHNWTGHHVAAQTPFVEFLIMVWLNLKRVFPEVVDYDERLLDKMCRNKFCNNRLQTLVTCHFTEFLIENLPGEFNKCMQSVTKTQAQFDMIKVWMGKNYISKNAKRRTIKLVDMRNGYNGWKHLVPQLFAHNFVSPFQPVIPEIATNVPVEHVYGMVHNILTIYPIGFAKKLPCLLKVLCKRFNEPLISMYHHGFNGAFTLPNLRSVGKSQRAPKRNKRKLSDIIKSECEMEAPLTQLNLSAFVPTISDVRLKYSVYFDDASNSFCLYHPMLLSPYQSVAPETDVIHMSFPTWNGLLTAAQSTTMQIPPSIQQLLDSITIDNVYTRYRRLQKTLTSQPAGMAAALLCCSSFLSQEHPFDIYQLLQEQSRLWHTRLAEESADHFDITSAAFPQLSKCISEYNFVTTPHHIERPSTIPASKWASLLDIFFPASTLHYYSTSLHWIDVLPHCVSTPVAYRMASDIMCLIRTAAVRTEVSKILNNIRNAEHSQQPEVHRLPPETIALYEAVVHLSQHSAQKTDADLLVISQIKEILTKQSSVLMHFGALDLQSKLFVERWIHHFSIRFAFRIPQQWEKFIDSYNDNLALKNTSLAALFSALLSTLHNTGQKPLAYNLQRELSSIAAASHPLKLFAFCMKEEWCKHPHLIPPSAHSST